ncbi:MAG: rod shape-determining protein [Clostridia bacterium]|nr:rod shape-determining protein [Clostridia bacterium]
MPIIAPDLGIDLGTSYTSIYVRGRGIVVNEPSLVVLNAADRQQVLAVGDEARFLMGRTPETLVPVFPIRAGTLSDFDTAEIMLRYFVRKAIGVSRLIRPRIVVSTPCNITDVQRKALTEALIRAGGKHVILVEKPFAAALGCGLPVYDPVGSMVADIGAGTTDVALISLGGTVVGQSIPVGGDRMDEAIMNYIRQECSLMIGRQTAESIKKDLASAMPLEQSRVIPVRGISRLNTSADIVDFSSTQAYEAIREACGAILNSLKWVLERTPPELAADIMRNGVHLTGAGSCLFALENYFSSVLGIPVILAQNPADCTITGIGYLTENIMTLMPQDQKAIYTD